MPIGRFWIGDFRRGPLFCILQSRCAGRRQSAICNLKSHPLVGDDDFGLARLQRQRDARRRHPGVLAHVGQGLLDDAQKLRLHLRRKEAGAGTGLQRGRQVQRDPEPVGAFQRVPVEAQRGQHSSGRRSGADAQDIGADVRVRVLGDLLQLARDGNGRIGLPGLEQGADGLRLHVDVTHDLAQAVVQLAAELLPLLGRGQRAFLPQDLRLRGLAVVHLLAQQRCLRQVCGARPRVSPGSRSDRAVGSRHG